MVLDLILSYFIVNVFVVYNELFIWYIIDGYGYTVLNKYMLV